MTYQPLDCGLYDFIEMVCMRHNLLDVEMLDGQRIKARALTTKTSASKEEYLQLESPNLLQEVRLDMISAITVMDEGAGYQRKDFTIGSCAV